VQPEDDRLSIRRQCALLSLPRSTLYYQPQEVWPEELSLMRVIDEEFMRYPFLGSRMMTQRLGRLGHQVNRKRVQRLMRVMGLESLAPKPGTSSSHPEHPKFPYLLRRLDVTRANQAWAADITYIPMALGFLYLVAIIDWFSRAVLAWRLSNTLDADFCIDALQTALHQWGTPTIFNTDQGAQFTAQPFIEVLQSNRVQISMDGKGRCLDNIFVERLWRSLKYEEVYLHAYDGGAAARRGIGGYFHFFNEERPHSALGHRSPMEVYRASLQLQRRAAGASR
jgi:putative transposase